MEQHNCFKPAHARHETVDDHQIERRTIESLQASFRNQQRKPPEKPADRRQQNAYLILKPKNIGDRPRVFSQMRFGHSSAGSSRRR